jgi:hypothetical protein
VSGRTPSEAMTIRRIVGESSTTRIVCISLRKMKHYDQGLLLIKAVLLPIKTSTIEDRNLAVYLIPTGSGRRERIDERGFRPLVTSSVTCFCALPVGFRY